MSFEMAEYTVGPALHGTRLKLMALKGDVDGLGTLRLLDAVRTCGCKLIEGLYWFQLTSRSGEAGSLLPG